MYQPINDATLEKLEEVEDILARATLHNNDKEELREELELISRQLGRYEGTNALESFLIEFLQTAETGELPVTDGGSGSELRPELEQAIQLPTKCQCGKITCKVNNGKLPGQLKNHGTGRYRSERDPEDELADFIRKHPEALALRRAKMVWDEWKGVLKGRILSLHTAAQRAIDRGKEDNPAGDLGI